MNEAQIEAWTEDMTRAQEAMDLLPPQCPRRVTFEDRIAELGRKINAASGLPVEPTRPPAKVWGEPKKERVSRRSGRGSATRSRLSSTASRRG